MAEPGDVIGEYTLISRLGSGGMGTVWEATSARGQRVALKVLHPGISADPEARVRLQREVTSLEKVRGARVAQVLDAHIAPEVSYVVTTLVEGLSLEESVAQEGAFDPLDLHPLAQGLHEAVSQVHRAGLLHRDIKPGNVMVTYDGPVLIDFGIAQALDDARLTHTGFVTGTPGYIDPATLHGGGPASDGDWYGLSAVLLFAATGRAPFGHGRMEVVLGRMATGSPDVEGLPAGVASAFAAALAPDPARRPDSRHLLDILRSWASGRDVSQATVMVPPPPAPTPPAQGTRTRVVPPAPTGPDPNRAAPPVPASSPPAPTYPPRPAGQSVPQPGATTPGAPPQPAAPPQSPAASPPGPVGPDGAPIPAWALAPRPRPGLVLAWAGLACALAFGWPGYAALAAAAGFVLFTLAGMLQRRTRARRYAAGPRPSDPWVSAGWAVPLLVPAAVTSLVPLGLGAIAAAVVWWIGTRLVLTEYADGVPAGASGFVVPVAFAVGMVVAWWVPLSQVTRLGARTVWGVLAPDRTFTWIWLGVAVVLGLVLLAVAPSDPVWTPLPAPPSG